MVSLNRIDQLKEQGLNSLYPQKVKIIVGRASCGRASGAESVYKRLLAAVENEGLDALVTSTGCLGFCQREPLVAVQYSNGPRYIYEKVTSELAEEIADGIKKDCLPDKSLLGKEEADEIILTGETVSFSGNSAGQSSLGKTPMLNEIPFYAQQVKIATRNCGYIDPGNIAEYVARGGYLALHKAVQVSPMTVIEEVKASGLRGRGGGGFSTGTKWELCHKSPGEQKYVICNADEGDPGAYMDRSLLEGDPHTILEGMAIGGYAMGAQTGIIYCRAEYPLAVTTLQEAIKQAEENGFLGDNIFGSGFNFHIKIVKGQGAFVCGEETALIASIEGKMGEPRPRPPFPAQAGLWGKPTNINNVETWANVPPIVGRGAKWYASFGTENSKGTKVFALVGNIKNNGLVEVPMGTTIAQIVYEIGGGTGEFGVKAVQTGGPSGGCIPAHMFSIPVDYDELKKVGAIMGSGGMVVMDERTCMVDVARYFLEFTQGESCGKCLPCREGTKQMLFLLQKICAGKADMKDLTVLEELAVSVNNAALCGLGQTAPNPVLATMKYFYNEYETHIIDKRCDASVCSDLVIAPCQNTCPAGIDVPLYIDLIKHKKYEAAFDLIYRDNPFPSVCGRVCPHPCATRCRRGVLDESIAIRELKRFVSDFVLENNKVSVKPVRRTRKKSVGIVGAGPAGLTAGHYLANLGYAVTVYEALPIAGGMLAVGIPEYRLPKKVLAKEISMIEQAGVEIKTNTHVGSDVSIEELKQKYDALFISLGAHTSISLGIDGEGLQGIEKAVDWLRDSNLGKEIELNGKKVVVIGGGNVAMDVARSAVRYGAKVDLVCIEALDDMPADEEEVIDAKLEGVRITNMVIPVKFEGTNGHVNKVICREMKFGDHDNLGRQRYLRLEDTAIEFEADVVVTAIGQVPDYAQIDEQLRISKGKTGRIEVDKRTNGTNVEGIFVGGDCVTGTKTVVEAIAAGKKAATAIDKYLGGEGVLYVTEPVIRQVVGPVAETGLRVKPKMLSVENRIGSFNEAELGYTEEMAVTEAARCMRCDCKEDSEQGCPGCNC